MKQSKNLSKKLTVFLIAVVTLSITGALLLFTMQNKQRITEQNREYLTDGAARQAANIDAALADGYDNIRILSSLISQSLTGPEFDVSSIQSLINDSVFDFVEFADTEGLDHTVAGITTDASDRQYYLQGVLQEKVGMDLIYNSRATHETLLMFYAPVYYEEEAIGAIIGVYQAANRITELLHREYFGVEAFSCLYSEIGRAVASSEGLDTRVESYMADHCGQEAAAAMLAGSSERSFVPEGNSAGGCIVRLPESGWFLLQIFPEEANARMVTAANLQGVWLSAFLLTIYVLVLVLFIINYRRQRSAELRARQQAERQNEIIRKLSEDYDYVCYIDARTDQVSRIYASEALRKRLAELEGEMSGEPMNKRLDRFMNAMILSEDYGGFRAAVDRSVIKRKLRNEGRLSTDFRVQLGEEQPWYRMRLVQDEKNPDGVILGVYSIDKEKQGEARLEEAYRMAALANEAKSTFLFNMSHDIRTPMNAITGYTAMAQKHLEDREKVSDYLEKISRAGSNLLTLVNQVLDMSRIEAGKVVLRDEATDLLDRSYEVTGIIGQSAEAKNLRLSCDVSAVTDRCVFADSGRLNQILMNILGNAVKYTPEGGSIDFTLEQKPAEEPGWGCYVFTVRDSGIGMNQEFVEQIFEPFSRENTSTVSRIEGTGLGMSIVKRLVDMMGGSIAVESVPGEGTSIAVTLSFRLQAAAAKPAEERARVNQQLLKGRRVLLVEDNEMNREIAEDILTEQGLLVETAEDGDVAVEMLQEKAALQEYGYYDFVLMDIQMPRMNGYEATRAIRAIAAPPEVHVPIIAMTANAFEEDRQNALQAGMDEHLSKPIQVQTLWETLERYLKK